VAGTESEASAVRGVLAGLAGTLLSLPLLAIGFVVAEFLKRMLLGKLLGEHVDSESMRHGSQAAFASIVLAFAAGGIGVGAAAVIADKLIRNGARKPFLAVLAIGVAAVLAGIGMWLKPRLPIGTGALVSSLVLAWLGGLLGMIAATMADEDEKEEGVPEVPAAG
jgi:hypothetical protein